MSRRTRFPAAFLLSAALAFVTACASSNPAPPVPVTGADVSALAGKWTGTYASEATGRTGSIVFELKSGDKVARGDVLMVPAGAKDAPTSGPEVARTMPQVLSISFVSATGGILRGTMEPYRDPSCDCEVQTTFVGRPSGDTIEGTYTTTPTGQGAITTGRWKITREKK